MRVTISLFLSLSLSLSLLFSSIPSNAIIFDFCRHCTIEQVGGILYRKTFRCGSFLWETWAPWTPANVVFPDVLLQPVYTVHSRYFCSATFSFYATLLSLSLSLSLSPFLSTPCLAFLSAKGVLPRVATSHVREADLRLRRQLGRGAPQVPDRGPRRRVSAHALVAPFGGPHPISRAKNCQKRAWPCSWLPKPPGTTPPLHG